MFGLSCLHPVFDMGPDNEVEGNDEGNDEPEGVAMIVFVSGQISSLSWRTTNPLGVALRIQGLLEGRKHISWKSVYDCIVLQAPRGWYNLMPLEKVVIGMYSRNFYNA